MRYEVNIVGNGRMLPSVRRLLLQSYIELRTWYFPGGSR